jgi:ribosomal protein S18 acetylase RimI-like enzyme
VIDDLAFAVSTEEAAAEMQPRLEPVIAAAFAQPPYSEARGGGSPALSRFAAQTRKPGYLLVTAGTTDEVVGLAFGYTLPATTGWWRDVLESVSAEVSFEDGERSFGLFELAVHPDWQQQGVAAHLHKILLTLITSRTEERVVLNCRPDAEAAQAAYASWGYRRVTATIPWEGAPVYDVLVLNLR